MYATLEQAKAHMGISTTDNDDAITKLIELVSDSVDALSNRDFLQHTVVNEYHTVQKDTVYLAHYPATGESVEYMAGDLDAPNWTAVAGSEYSLDERRGSLTFNDDTYNGKRVRVSYTGGYDEVPSGVHHAVLSFVARIWAKKVDDGKDTLAGIEEGLTMDDIRAAVGEAEQNTILSYVRSF